MTWARQCRRLEATAEARIAAGDFAGAARSYSDLAAVASRASFVLAVVSVACAIAAVVLAVLAMVQA